MKARCREVTLGDVIAPANFDPMAFGQMSRIFISYSHDSPEHKERVLELADQICRDGFDCRLDQYETSPVQGWPRWMLDQIEESVFVLVVCTETYNLRFRGKTPKGSGRGAKWEGAVITQELYDAESNNTKFVPVVLSPDDPAHIPVVLRGATHFDCSDAGGYENLLRHLTGQPLTPQPELGQTPNLPPRQRQGSPVAEQLSGKLRQARDRLKQLMKDGADPAAIEAARAEILAARREIREGGRLRPGDVLSDRYELIECVGSGGFATVWKCYDEVATELVAAKILHPRHHEERSRVERFFRGARLMKQLTHENIVRVREDRCSDEGFHFYIMDFVDGDDFQRAVVSGRLSPSQVFDVILAAGEALAYAHQMYPDLVHRDVKPSNILLDTSSKARVTDFDLVRMADTTGGTRTGSLGTFIYAAPEAMAKAGDADVRADVFSLGMTAVFGLHGEELPVAAFRQTSEFIALLDCGDRVKEVLNRAVSWEANDRFQSMQEFCKALRTALKYESNSLLTTLAQMTSRRRSFVSEDGVLTNSIGMRLKLILPGEYMMGAPDTDQLAKDDEKPQHKVHITRPFYLGVHPVTQEEYEILTGQNPSYHHGDQRRPVEYVSWVGAVQFCNQLSEHEELAAYYDIQGDGASIQGGKGYRLPTEAEWEYACRAGTKTRWYCGDEPNELSRYAWFNNQSEGTSPVGGRELNAWGVCDMHGNVWEWCYDWYVEEYYQQSESTDPTGPQSGWGHVLRGGAYWNDSDSCRSSARVFNNPYVRDCNYGFRVARAYE